MSTRGDYAARALLSLALHGTERPTSVKEIAERTHLPQPYLEQILLSVKGAGLVRSKRGVGGGYVLARAPARDHAGRHRRRGRRPADPAGRAPRPLRGALHPAGGVGRRRRRVAPHPRARHARRARRAHPRRPSRRSSRSVPLTARAARVSRSEGVRQARRAPLAARAAAVLSNRSRSPVTGMVEARASPRAGTAGRSGI